MRIGIVTTWLERGASYVSRSYMKALEQKHDVFIYARGGETYAKKDPVWNLPNVTWAQRCRGLNVDRRDFKNWIDGNHIDAVLFNEQQDWRIVVYAKKELPQLLVGAYVDYYNEATIPWFSLYDFVICNTKRHMQAMSDHPQAIYIPWGTDVNLFRPSQGKQNSQLSFFHSAGMSERKGTELLLDAFIKNGLGEKSKLIVHSQLPIRWATSLNDRQLEANNIQIIQKTVSAPGLYELGDVYVYPTRLDGLGLTMYEALACGLPVIATDYPPMNEVIDETVGRLVKVERNYARADAYYWPMSVCDPDDLAEKMLWYIEDTDRVRAQQKNARERALERHDWTKQYDKVCTTFECASVRDADDRLVREIEAHYRKENLKPLFGWAYQFVRDNPALARLVKSVKNG